MWALVPSTTTFGLPTSSTFDTLERQLRGGWHVLRTAPAPAPVTDGTLLLAVIATWAVATVADWLAFRRNATLAAVAPALVLFVWSSTLGTSDHQTLTVSAFAVAAGAFLMVQNIAVLDQRRSWLVSSKPARGHWLAPAVLLGLVALLVGLVLAPALPGAENDPILEFANSGPNRNGGRSYSTRVPPLVDVGAKLQTEDNYEVFTVQASQPEYWRLTALDDFTTEGGGQWTLSAEGGDEVDDDLPERLTDGTFHQEFDIGRLGERWLPAAFRPVAASTPALVVRSSGTLVSDEDTVQGLQYTADSRLAPLRAAITPEQQAATARRGPRGTAAVHHAPRRDADGDRGHRGTGRRRCGRDHSLRAGGGTPRLLLGELRLRPRCRPARRHERDRELHLREAWLLRPVREHVRGHGAIARHPVTGRGGVHAGRSPRRRVPRAVAQRARLARDLARGARLDPSLRPHPTGGKQRRHRGRQLAARRRDDRAAGDPGRRDDASRPTDFDAHRRDRHADDGDHERAGSPARHHDRAGRRLAAVARRRSRSSPRSSPRC